jgi:hypothetical protein
MRWQLPEFPAMSGTDAKHFKFKVPRCYLSSPAADTGSHGATGSAAHEFVKLSRWCI